MILSKKHKFIFIKGRKVASTSIEVLPSHLCGNDDIITPISPIDELKRLSMNIKSAQNFGLNNAETIKYLSDIKNTSADKLNEIRLPKSSYYNHMSLKEVFALQKKKIVNWHIFAFERNPYSKIISYANMQLKYREYIRNGKPMINSIDDLKKQLDQNFTNGSIIDVKNIDLYKSNNKLATKIYKYENLEQEINTLFSNLSIKEKPILEHYKKGVSSNSIDPRSIFSTQQIVTINKLFKEEFILFNYAQL